MSELDLDSVLAQINGKYGKGSAVQLTDAPLDVDVISTGSLALDKALGVGGLPRGRIVEIYGNESTGKTTVLIHAMVQAQRMGENVALVDMEHAFDRQYAEHLGLDLDRVVFCQPETAEQAMDIYEMMCESGKFAIVALDSVAALPPTAEIQGDMGDSHIGLVARLMGQAMRKLTPVVSRTNTCAVFINQMRDAVNAMGYGPRKVTTGGNALKFYASVRIDMRRKGGVKGKSGDTDIGNVIKVKIAKNKVAPPFKEVDMELIFGEGFCPVKEIVGVAVKAGIIEKGGAWFKYGDHSWQGAEAVRQALSEDEELFNEIKELITGE